jgi:hypothetical protein
MKKLPVFMLAMILSGIATAQTLIPRLGGTMAKVSMADNMLNSNHTNTFKSGFLIGAGYEIAISDLLAIQPEFLFHQKGSKIRFSNGSFDQTVGLNYLELPVLVKLKFGIIYVTAGPYAAFGIGGNYKFENDGDSFSSKVKFGKEPDNYSGDDAYIENAFDFGIAISGGVVLFERIEIDIRYSHGFADIHDFGNTFVILESNGDSDNKIMNRSIQLSVGYRIGLK